ncbi:hypothetical protein Tco_0763761, partial [Tanacetum coccineum]
MDMSNIARKRSKTNKKREKDKESRARVRNQPDQPDTARKKVKGQHNKDKGLKVTSSQSLKALFEVLEIKGLKLQKRKMFY